MELSAHVNSLFSSVSYLIDKHTLVDVGDWLPDYAHISSVLLTHCHYDHIYGLNRIIESNSKVIIYTNGHGREMLLDCKKNLSFYHESPFILSDCLRITTVNDGEEVTIDNGEKARAIFTPGHNPSCISWLVGDLVFTGDAYIPGIKTVTNLPGGNRREADKSLDIINKFLKNRSICPGHKIC